MKSRSNSNKPEVVAVDQVQAGKDVQLQLPRMNGPDFTPSASPTRPKLPHILSLPRSPAVTSFQQMTTDDGLHTSENITTTMPSSTATHTPSHGPTTAQPDLTSHPSSPPSSSGDNSPWIGGTGLGNSGLGKSGKVIERLMAECDRLKRELKSEVAKREELQRAAQHHNERLEALHTENCRMSNAKTMDDNMIKRRDRKIEELKAELQVEKQKRDSLESRAQEAEKKVEDMEQASNEHLQRFMEEAKQATTTATIYQTSHKQLRDEYQQRIASTHRSLRELHEKRDEDRREREKDRKKMVKIDVVNQQMRQELEKTRRAYNDLMTSSDKDRDDKASVIDGLLRDMERIRDDDQRRELEFQEQLSEMHETVNQMKWVMAVKKVSDENGLQSPPPSPPG